MGARIVRQDQAIQEQFRKRIQAKEEKPKIERERTRNGKNYVRVYGSKEGAAAEREDIKLRAKAPGH